MAAAPDWRFVWSLHSCSPVRCLVAWDCALLCLGHALDNICTVNLHALRQLIHLQIVYETYLTMKNAAMKARSVSEFNDHVEKKFSFIGAST